MNMHLKSAEGCQIGGPGLLVPYLCSLTSGPVEVVCTMVGTSTGTLSAGLWQSFGLARFETSCLSICKSCSIYLCTSFAFFSRPVAKDTMHLACLTASPPLATSAQESMMPCTYCSLVRACCWKR